MTRTIVAILALSPVLVHAQAKSPAQPGSTPVLQSSYIQPAALVPVNSTDTSAAAAPLRVSTGITPPERIHYVDINPSRFLYMKNSGGDHTVVIDMTVDESGKPVDLKVKRSVDQFTDAAVLAVVRQFRYKPATLDGTPVAIPDEVAYTIQAR